MKTREQWCASRKVQSWDTSCDILKLKPADPMATPEGRYAHSIRLPMQPAANVFVKGMNSEQYFSALCEKQAGEFIFKVVNDVSGVMQMRPRAKATDYMLQHLHVIEDPFGQVTEGEAEYSKHALVRPSRYRFIERPISEQAQAGAVLRIVGINPNPKKNMFDELQEEKASVRSVGYGYTWRGVEIPNGREHGIVGSELLIMDLSSNEVIAVRRGLIRSGDVRNVFTGVWWMGGHICPKPSGRAEYYTYEFLTKVLTPMKTSEGAQHGK